MNRELRQWHRWMACLLAIVAMTVLAASLWARRQVPASAIPAVLRGDTVTGHSRVAEERSPPEGAALGESR